LDKIDFSGGMHFSDKSSKTNMIIAKMEFIISITTTCRTASHCRKSRSAYGHNRCIGKTGQRAQETSQAAYEGSIAGSICGELVLDIRNYFASRKIF